MASNYYIPMTKLFILSVIILFIVCMVKDCSGRPIEEEEVEDDDSVYGLLRKKRSGISDQRLAELETLLALKRLRNQQLRTRTPVAYGLFDPAKIGKRRKREHHFKLFSDDDGGLYRMRDRRRIRVPNGFDGYFRE